MATLCLVPGALRAARAARRLCDAADGILLGARVLTPEQLPSLVLGATAERRALLTPTAERLLALEALAAAAPFGEVAPGGGLARAVVAAIGELRRGEVTSRVVRSAAGDLDGGAADRLAGLADALARYEARLEALEVLDAAAAMRAAGDALERGARGELSDDLDLLVLEGLHALPPATLDLVVALARRATRTHARVPFFPERAELCGPAEPLVRRLEALPDLGHGRGVSLAFQAIAGDEGERAPLLARVLLGMGGGRSDGPAGEGGAVLAAAGAGEDGEAEVAADLVARLLDARCPPDDVVVIGPRAAASRLAQACRAVGVPFATGLGRPLRDEPAVRPVRVALAAALEPGRHALESLLGSSYLRLSDAPVPARLREALDRAGAVEGRGDAEGSLRRRAAAVTAPSAAPERALLLRAADAVRAASAAVRPLAMAGRPRDHADRLRAFLTVAGVRRRADRGDPELARRDLAALGRLDEAIDDVVRALGLLGRAGEQLPAPRWRELVELALEGASTAPVEAAAGAVELWPVEACRGLASRAAILVGCAAGAFPPALRPDPLLGEVERAAVNRAAGRAALSTGAARRADAMHAAFCALAVARETVALTWPAAGPQGPGPGPSPLALEALALAGVAAPQTPSPDPPLGASRSGAQALRAVVRAARRGQAGPAVEALAAANPALGVRAASALARGAIEEERRAAVAARRATPFSGAIPVARLPELQARLPDEWTPSQLEAHARCPFRFFAGSVLALGERDGGDVDVDPRDEGQLAHAILDRLLRELRARGALPIRDTEEVRQHLAAVAGALFAHFEAGGRTGDPAVWAARRAGVLRRLERVLAAEAAAADEAIPTLLEHPFGGGAGAPCLVFTDGEGDVKLRGRLDRVDASATRLVVIDYKNSRSSARWAEKLAVDAVGVTSFQLPAYLMAAARALPGRSHLEATYLLLGAAERVAPLAVEAGDPLLALEEGARAEARARGETPFADAVLGAVRRIRSGALPVASRDCTGCGFGVVCRFPERAEEEP